MVCFWSYVDVPIGFKFHPSDDELLRYYLLNKVCGTPFMLATLCQNSIFMLVTSKGSRVARTIGNGTWKGEDRRTMVGDPAKNNKPLGLCKRFRYENDKSDQHGRWIMHEYSLHPSLVKPHSNSNLVVVMVNTCSVRIRKKDRKRKLSENDGFGGHALVLQSPTKILRQLENNDEVVGANFTPISEASEQQEQTTSANAYLPMNQPHYFLTDYPTTMASASTSPPPSLPQPDYGFELISDTDHQPAQGFNYDLSQFLDDDDVDALMKDLSNLDNIQPLAAQPLGGGSHPYPSIIQESAVDEDSGNIINSGFGISSEDQTGGELGTENVQLNVLGFPEPC
ncbi:PREDICTED: NAC [Prunus dulcis]|uniref:PREDICTED: NAC n=1 Tax=Prunus dulcis TaxID=3755 RepID=A0A5E4EV81_PRUDU|nr:PREDICTED: NAC [Prunus dulcis]